MKNNIFKINNRCLNQLWIRVNTKYCLINLKWNKVLLMKTYLTFKLIIQIILIVMMNKTNNKKKNKKKNKNKTKYQYKKYNKKRNT